MTNFELIDLTLNEIRRSLTSIELIRKDYGYNSVICKDDFMKKIATSYNDFLNSTRLELRDILEKVANYQNDNDMIQEVDMALTETPYDLIYERKNENDYE